MENLKILVKYPTRSRPQLFLKTLGQYVSMAYGNANNQYLISYDIDDNNMSEGHLDMASRLGQNIVLVGGESKNKIHACNRDMDFAFDWDIILLVSDDMHPQINGWDDIIRMQMQANFPDLDGCLWFHDGSIQKQISTLTCMGKKYFDRFGYIYYPEYKSFFCDNEYTEVAQKLGKIKFIDQTIIRHNHPANNPKVKTDALYLRNNEPWEHDKELYMKRKSQGFPC